MMPASARELIWMAAGAVSPNERARKPDGGSHDSQAQARARRRQPERAGS